MKLTLIFIVVLGFFLLNAATAANGSSDREDKKSIEKSAKNVRTALSTSSKSNRASGRRERTRNSSPAAERRRKSGEERRRQETRGDKTPLKSGRETERKSGRSHSSGRPSSSKTPDRKSGSERKSTTARKRSPSVGRTSNKMSRGRTPTRKEPLKEVESSKIKTGFSIQTRSKTPLARRSESSRQRSSSNTQQRSKSGGGKRHSSVSSSRQRDVGRRHKSTGRRHSSGTRRSQDRRPSNSSGRSRPSRSHSRHYSSSRIGRAKPEGKKMSAEAIFQINEIWNKFVEDFGENFCHKKISKGQIVDTIRDSLRKKTDIDEFFIIFDRHFVKNTALKGPDAAGGEIFKQFFKEWRQKIEKKTEFEPKVKANLLLYGIAGAMDSTIKLLILDYGHLMASETDAEAPFDWSKHQDIERQLTLLQQIMDVHESMANGFEPTKYMDQNQAISLDKFIQERMDYSQPL